MRVQYLIFTFHKAGSMALHRYLGWLAGATGLAHHSPNNRNEEPEKGIHLIAPEPKQNDPDWWQATGRHLDGLIGPIRRPVVLPKGLDARGAIAVRDPRDALTSMFFSFAMSHGGIEDAQRKAWLDMGIDKFVMQRLPDLKGRLVAYRAMLDTRHDWPLLRYEDMVLRFDAWLTQLLDGLALQPDAAAVADFTAATKSEYESVILQRQQKERADLHVRTVAPGDHLKKLRPETIAAIDAALADELAFFGYARSAL